MEKRTIALFILGFLYLNNLFSQEFKKTLKINGRIQADYEFLSRAEGGYELNGFEFRRVHLSATGKLSPKIKYKIETDFAQGQIGFRDVYIKFLGGKVGNLSIGSMPEPTGLDMLTSSKYILFTERAMITSLQNFRWGAGLHYENFSILKGQMGFQLALTNNGNNNEGFKDVNLEAGNNLVARLTGTPINNKEKKQLIHLGINLANRPGKDLKFRPENHLGEKYHYIIPNGDRRNELGLEFAGTFKNFSLQTEYKKQDISNDLNLNFNFQSYYVFVSYFLTGENRPYKHGAFVRVKPKKDIDHNGYGAFEVVARFSNMKASQAVVNVNPGLPDNINNISLGINWYLTAHTRIMYNYITTDDNSSLGNLNGHIIRAQIDF